MSDVHVHPGIFTAVVTGHLVCVDDRPVAVATSLVIAERLVHLIEAFGLLEVPDSLGDVS